MMIYRLTLWNSILILATVCRFANAEGTEHSHFVHSIGSGYNMETADVSDNQKYGRKIQPGSIANVFALRQGRTFRFHMWPLDECLEVVLCSGPEIKEAGGNNSTKDPMEDFCKGDKLVFRPAEHTVTLGSGGPKYYSRPDVKFEAKAGESEYTLETMDDFDGVNFSPTSKITFKLSSESLAVLTSSERCQIQVAIRGHGLASQYVVTHPDYKLTPMKTRYRENTKSDHQLIHQTGKWPTVDDKAPCPKFWGYTGFRRFTQNDKVSFTSYLVNVEKKVKKEGKSVSVNAQGKNDQKNKEVEKDIDLQSVMLEIANPEKCKWVRVCFGTHQDQCKDTKKSLELLLSHRIFVPTDNDHARAFGINIDKLKHIQFRFYEDNVMEMGYAVAHSSGGMLAREQMHLDWNPKMNKARIHVVSAEGCKVMLANDNGRAVNSVTAYRDNQLLAVTQCECYAAKKH